MLLIILSALCGTIAGTAISVLSMMLIMNRYERRRAEKLNSREECDLTFTHTREMCGNHNCGEM